jgi:hypothetical protein
MLGTEKKMGDAAYLGPHLGRAAGLAVGARVVPLVDAAGLAVEAARRGPRVDNACSKHLRVGGRHDVLRSGVVSKGH